MKILCFLLLLFYSVGLSAQLVSIPDTSFANSLNILFPGCLQGDNQTGWQLDTSCPAVLNASKVNLGGPFTDLNGLQYFHNVDTLNLGGMNVTGLPPLPDSLRSLSCQVLRQLIALPPLPSTLTYLSCYNTALTHIPALPASMKYLYLSDNQLVSLPILPDSLEFLNFAGNHINTMPALPNTLHTLAFAANNISHVPYLPPSLLLFYCDRNQITSLPELPDTLYYCTIYSNPISCLPKLKYISNLDFSNTLVTCLPNYGHVVSSTPPLSSLPICDMYNSNLCEVYWNISGKIHHDGNNCFADSLEVRNIPVQLWQNGILQQQTYSVGDGTYAFDADGMGTYEVSIDTSQVPLHVSCPANNRLSLILTPADSIQENQNFAIECDSGFDLRVRNMTSERFRPGNKSRVRIAVGESGNFYDMYCATLGGVVTTTINGTVSYISPVIGALSPGINGNVLSYNIADFAAVDFNGDFDIVVQTDTTAQIGDTICFTVTVTPTIGDYNPANNTLTHCFTVRGSYDPNNKEVYPVADIDTTQEWLTYTINFQNTGTAEAEHIYVTDTLDNDLDYSSFQLLAYSHQPLVQVKENILRFNFPNINLPDSNANEPLSHGYVQYKVKLKENLSIGTRINNTAYIYFDFNAPVVTNTTSNTITDTLILSDFEPKISDFRLFPNPARNSLGITISESSLGSTLTIYDLTGKKVCTVYLTNQYSKINTELFSSGVYIAEIQIKDSILRQKWVKL